LPFWQGLNIKIDRKTTVDVNNKKKRTLL